MRWIPWLAMASALATSGCAFFKSLVGRNYVDLEDADVQAMSVDIRKEQKTVCPRERVQMAVFLKAKLDGEDAYVEYQTWQGDENRNDKLDFEPFHFHANLGSFDEEGYFSPHRDLLKSIDREFVIHTVLKSNPDKFTMKMSYKPDYRCIVDSGVVAQAGGEGASGSDGASGSSGASGGVDSRGGDGSSGGSGSDGARGEDGARGPQLEVFATMVSTKYYDKLVAVKIGGGHDDFVVFAPEQPFVVLARGGDGGSGGNGGRGGNGGSGGSGNPGGNGGPGGPGGNGGNGGNGGDGGSILLVIDERYPEIAGVLQLDASGGAAGPGGAAGAAGYGGTGGSGVGQGATSGTKGADGQAGQGGENGMPGRDGETRTVHGNVDSAFSGLPGVYPLGEAPKDAPEEAAEEASGETP